MEYVSATIAYIKYSTLKLLKFIFYSVEFTVIFVGIITTGLILWWIFVIPASVSLPEQTAKPAATTTLTPVNAV